MNGFWFIALLLAAGAVCEGCSKAAPSAASAGSSSAGSSQPPLAVDPDEPTQAQPKLQTLKLWLGPEELNAELALTLQQQRTGMMFRTNLAENASMLFPLPYTQKASFWMKNCPSALSAAYISPDGVIQEIHDLQPFNTNAVTAASDNIRFVLETPQGWFQKHQIHEGMMVATERGPLMRTFFGKR
jgi:uncharacterized membrane protein (UPF0127 family)